MGSKGCGSLVLAYNYIIYIIIGFVFCHPHFCWPSRPLVYIVVMATQIVWPNCVEIIILHNERVARVTVDIALTRGVNYLIRLCSMYRD